MSGARNMADNMYKIDIPFKDSISDLQFSKQQRYLAATSWDGSICVWEFNEQYSSSTLKFKYPDISATSDDAFLRCCFNGDGTTVFWSSSLGKIYQANLNQPQSTISPLPITIKFPIVGLKFSPEKNALIILQNCGNTIPDKGGVLSIVATKDNASELYEVNLDSKPINMDLNGTTVVIALLGPKICKVDIKTLAENNLKPQKLTTKLEYQIRSIAISPANPQLCLATSIFGQLEILPISSATASKIIPCHRNEKESSIYTVNCVAPHPTMLGAITCGSEGNLTFFNLEKERQGRTFGVCAPYQLTAVAISNQGEVCAIAQGYDWSCGGKTFNEHRKDLEGVFLFIKKIQRDMF